MSKAIIFLIISAILLLQCTLIESSDESDSSSDEKSKERVAIKPRSNAICRSSKSKIKSKSDSSSSSSSSEESKETTANVDCTAQEEYATKSNDPRARKRKELLSFAMRELTELAYYSMLQGKNILKKVIKDLAVITEESSTLEERVNTFSAHVKRVEIFEANPDNATPATIFQYLEQFSKIVEQYKTATLTKVTTEILLCELTMQKNGLIKFEREFKENFMEFSKKFVKKIDIYLAPLSEEQRKSDEQSLILWFDSYKAEQYYEKKLNLAAKFFDLYSIN